MKIKKLVSGLKSKYFPSTGRVVERTLLGKQLHVIDGTLREVDYDDAWFYYLAKHSSVFFDIGSNIGQTALLANVIGNVKRILLVDPNPDAMVFASKNLILNNLAANCSFYTAFVGSRDLEEVKFHTIGVGSSGSMFESHAETARLVNSFYYVKTVTIDYLLDYYALVPDLVKVDVEGAEVIVLCGAYKLARKNSTRFLIEMHTTKECSMEENMNKILEWTKDVGYKAYFLVNGTEVRCGADLAHRGRCHILLQPSAWHYPSFLEGVKESAPLPVA